jgi:N-acetylgalactosamine kinase
LHALESPPGSDAARLELAAALAEAERYVGTHGGGMDQAIILLGDERSACKIDFFPLRVERIALFQNHTFVVCDSLVKASKSGNARQRYNTGPALTRLLCAMAEKQAQRTYDDQVRFEHLGDLWHGPLCLTHAEAAALINECLPRPRTRLDEAADFLGITAAQVRERFIGDLPEPPDGFRLQARARHQLTEFARVELARDLMLAGDAAGFGALMDASHQSCADDFEVSCEELEALVAIARDSGSIGSRLTGAGFGGCTVNLVPHDCVEPFTRSICQRYHIDYLGCPNSTTLPETAVFPAHASAGASIM